MSKEAMKLALEALTATMATHGFREHIEEAQDKAIKVLEEALAKQEQRSDSEHTGEPVAWTLDSLEQEIYANTRTFVSLNVMEWLLTRLNTTPPQGEARGLSQQQRTWVGLTEDEKECLEIIGGKADRMLAEEVEAKLKEKNT